MKIGVTASRNGLSPLQKDRLVKELQPLAIAEFRYGDCVGGDEETLEILVDLGKWHGAALHSHPGTMNPAWDERWRARTAEKYPHLGIIEHPAEAPMVRNRIIVDSVDLMFGLPDTMFVVPRSGTWATIAYANRQRVPIRVIRPNGEVF